MKVAIALTFAIVFGAIGDILMSIGMRSRGEIAIRKFSDIPSVIKLIFTTPCVLLGIVSMAIYFGSYIAALAWVDVSVANPLTALSYLIASIYAFVFLREHIDIRRAAGILFIILGAIFVGISS